MRRRSPAARGRHCNGSANAARLKFAAICNPADRRARYPVQITRDLQEAKVCALDCPLEPEGTRIELPAGRQDNRDRGKRALAALTEQPRRKDLVEQAVEIEHVWRDLFHQR